MDVAIFTRIYSKSDPDDLNHQIEKLRVLAKNNEWKIVKVIEAKKTGLPIREDIAELFDLVDNKTIQKVLVTDLPRLGRNPKEICFVYEYLENNNVSICIHSLGLDTSAIGSFQKAISNMIVTILTEIADQQKAIHSDRIKLGMEKARKNGKVIGRPKGSLMDFNQRIENDDQYKSAKWLLSRGVGVRRTAALSGIAVNTVRKIKKAIKKSDQEIIAS